MTEPVQRTLRVDTRDASIAAVRAAAYRLGDLLSILVEPSSDHFVNIQCTFSGDPSAAKVDAIMKDFLRELNDQVLREQVREETKHVRAVIMAHAFSRTKLGRDD